MAKMVYVDGVWCRWRRGKLVQIPAKWLGKVPSKRTINARQSKKSTKARRRDKSRWHTVMYAKDKQSREQARLLAHGHVDK